MILRRKTLRRTHARGPTVAIQLAVLVVLAPWRRATAQVSPWVAIPLRATVGDTIWLAREIPVPAGWRVRPGKLEAREDVEPLGDPDVLKSRSGWVVRYAIAAWTPGTHALELPELWRLGPDGRADSSAGGTASFTVVSVIPDSLRQPSPRGPLAPLRQGRLRPVAPLTAVGISLALLAAAVALRRRPPRPVPPRPQVPVEREVPDVRWIAAGEPKAVATRATWRLRSALARAAPKAHLALASHECLDVFARARPHAPLAELREVLEQLDRVAYAAGQGSDVAAIATRARKLAKEVAP